MKKIYLILFLILIYPSISLAQFFTPPGQPTTEQDGSPDLRCLKYKFPNNTVTDNADGTCSIAISGGGSSSGVNWDTIDQIQDIDDDWLFVIHDLDTSTDMSINWEDLKALIEGVNWDAMPLIVTSDVNWDDFDFGGQGDWSAIDETVITGVNWDAYIGGGSGTPGGSDKQIQFNDDGDFGGFGEYDETAQTLDITLQEDGSLFRIMTANGVGGNNNEFWIGEGTVPSILSSSGQFALYHTQNAILRFTGVTGSDKTFDFPNESGTLALTSDIPDAVNWDEMPLIVTSGVNWDDFDLTQSDTYNNTNWDTAYGWGDHGAEGYLTAVNWEAINWALIDITDANWDAVDELVLTGINWSEYENIAVNWAEINWAQIDITEADWSGVDETVIIAINWAEYENVAVNWEEMPIIQHTGINWDDIDETVITGINWDAYIGGGDTSGLVPYTGANDDVDLGTYSLTAGGLTTPGLTTAETGLKVGDGTDQTMTLLLADQVSPRSLGWDASEGCFTFSDPVCIAGTQQADLGLGIHINSDMDDSPEGNLQWNSGAVSQMLYGDAVEDEVLIGGAVNHVKVAEGGVVTFEGTASIDLTKGTGLPVSGITSSTSTALGVGSVELGHASDTTLSRSAAGVLAVEGVVVPTVSSTNTLTNKRITPRVTSETSSATPTINTDNSDIHRITALAVDITSMTTNLSGTPTHGQKLIIEITGTAARAITWGASFEASTVALPTTTVTTNMLTVGFIWNSATSKWRVVAVA